MPQIGCTWGVDVHKNPVRQHHVSVARSSDEMVIQAPGQLRANWILFSTTVNTAVVVRTAVACTILTCIIIILSKYYVKHTFFIDCFYTFFHMRTFNTIFKVSKAKRQKFGFRVFRKRSPVRRRRRERSRSMERFGR